MICYRKDLRRQRDVADLRRYALAMECADLPHVCHFKRRKKIARYTRFIDYCNLAMGGYGNASLHL